MNNKFSWLVSVILFTAEIARAATGQPVGGGTTDGGLVGEYFANSDCVGQPAFTRGDVRVRFDWGAKLPVLGVRAASLRDFPRENFSVRWTGQLAARFDEAYAFTLKADGGEAKLWIDGKSVGTRRRC